MHNGSLDYSLVISFVYKFPVSFLCDRQSIAYLNDEKSARIVILKFFFLQFCVWMLKMFCHNMYFLFWQPYTLSSFLLISLLVPSHIQKR